MAQLVLPPGYRVTDAAGKPVSDAKIKFWRAGSDEPLTVFADGHLEEELGVVVRTRSDGMPVSGGSGSTSVTPVFAGQPYKIEITDADDVVIVPAMECNNFGAAGAADQSLSAYFASLFSSEDATDLLGRLGAAPKSGLRIIEANGTLTDIGAYPEPTIYLSGVGPISYLGEKLAPGESKRLIALQDGLTIFEGTYTKLAMSRLAPWYRCQANDELVVTCIGSEAGHNVHRVGLGPMSGMSATASSLPGVMKLAACWTESSGFVVRMFADGVTAFDPSSRVQGETAGKGLPSPGRQMLIVNPGDGGLNDRALRCDIRLNNQLGGTDGSFSTDSVYANANGGLGTPIIVHLLWDGNTPIVGPPHAANIGLMASTNGAAPDNGWTQQFQFTTPVFSTIYSAYYGNRLPILSKAQGCAVAEGEDIIPLASGVMTGPDAPWATKSWGGGFAGAGVAALVPLAFPSGGGLYIFRVSGVNGDVKLAPKPGSRGKPWFENTGTGTRWTRTVHMPDSASNFQVYSTDPQMTLHLVGAHGDPVA